MFIRGSKLNLTLSHRLERKWKPFRIGSRAPPRFITEIVPFLRGGSGSPSINPSNQRKRSIFARERITNVMPFHTFSVLAGLLVAIRRQKHWTRNNQSYPVIISVILRGVLNLIRFSGWSGATAISRSSARRWSTVRTRETDICMNNSLSYLPFFRRNRSSRKNIPAPKNWLLIFFCYLVGSSYGRSCIV